MKSPRAGGADPRFAQGQPLRVGLSGSYLDLGAGVDVGDVGGDAGGARDIVQGELGHEGVLRRGKREAGQRRVRQIGADCPSVP